MAQKKESKKDIKVQDLAPKKDAKGGAARRAEGAINPNAAGRRPNASIRADGGSRLN